MRRLSVSCYLAFFAKNFDQAKIHSYISKLGILKHFNNHFMSFEKYPSIRVANLAIVLFCAQTTDVTDFSQLFDANSPVEHHVKCNQLILKLRNRNLTTMFLECFLHIAKVSR